MKLLFSLFQYIIIQNKKLRGVYKTPTDHQRDITSPDIRRANITQHSIFQGSNTTADFACQISTFAAKLKADLPGLKVGMMVDGYRCDDYGNTTSERVIVSDRIEFESGPLLGKAGLGESVNFFFLLR